MFLKAFTFIETLVVLLIISIIASVAVYKSFFSLEKAHLLQIKSDIALIRNAIIKKHNQSLLLGNVNRYPTKLDDALSNIANEKLFDDVLDYPIFSTSHTQKELSKWIKESKTIYSIYLTSSNSVSFNYDQNKGTFECDFQNKLCKELYQ